MIDNLSDCKKAAKQLNLRFRYDEEEYDQEYFPGGCFVYEYMVLFNTNLNGLSEGSSKPICSKGKYDKYIIRIFKL